MGTLADMRQNVVDLQSRATALQARIDNEGRGYSEQEAAEFDSTLNEIDRLFVDMKRRERLEQAEQFLQEPASPRVSPPVVPVNNTQGPRPNGKPYTPPPARVEVSNRSFGTHGFINMGEFAQAVKEACIGGRVDMRLLNSAGPPPNVMTEGVNADGGYAVPPDFRPDIRTLISGDESLLPYTDQITTSSNAVTMPVDATSPWGTGGIRAYWGPEAGQKTTSKAAISSLICRLYKLYALIVVSDELIEDAPALGNLILTKAPMQMMYQVNGAILNGNGTTQPQGILGSAATVTVPRAVPGQVTFADVMKMWGALYGPSRRRAVWIANQDIEAQLMGLFFPIPPTGTATGGWPIYLPPGGLSQAPYSTLLGRPVIVTEAAQDTGVKGDLVLADLSQYLTASKAGGIKTDISIHLWFDWDCSAYRLVWRLGGVPIWSAPVQSHWGTHPRSPFVVLDGTAPQPVLANEEQLNSRTGPNPMTTQTAGGAISPERKRMSE